MKSIVSGMNLVPCFFLALLCSAIPPSDAQASDDYTSTAAAAPPPEEDACDGIFVSYAFIEREKEYPHVKNASAQSWAFKSVATVLNAGIYELKAWKIYIGFQHDEILVSAGGAVVVNGDDFPVHVGKEGLYLAGYPQTDLETAIDTAGDVGQISVAVDIKGTQFGVKPPAVPMPKTIRLVNDGYKCPAAKRRSTFLSTCCKRDPKFKAKKVETKFLPRQYGDLSLVYDVLQAYGGNYLAQVTIDNVSPLGRLDHWNLTWEWMRNEFIYSMRGAYTHVKDPSDCIYGVAGQYYKDLDFSTVMNCQKRPVISDLPAEMKNDDKVGKLPYCCRNGTLLPTTMNATKSRAIFQLQVYKMPPDLNRTAFSPPQKWKINGVLNPEYKCGPPIRIDPTEFPDPSGLDSKTEAIASWQVTCNITKPKARQSRCCVSFSAYYSAAAVPCNTCACGGCEEANHCNPNLPAMPIPADALLVPFDNRTEKAKAFARLHKQKIPLKLPCPDNCGVSLNWHVNTDYKTGWTARITLFNWEDFPFDDWFTAIQMKKAYLGYENVYSFNGTRMPDLNNTIFMQGLPGLNYLIGEVNGTHPETDPRVPGKLQTVISFLKKKTPNINVARGDGFPTKVIFNGEECALPTEFPKRSNGYRSVHVGFLPLILLLLASFLLIIDRN